TSTMDRGLVDAVVHDRGISQISSSKSRVFGGEGGIRTLGTVTRTTVFETVPIDHSGTSPRRCPLPGRAEDTYGLARSQGRARPICGRDDRADGRMGWLKGKNPPRRALSAGIGADTGPC